MFTVAELLDGARHAQQAGDLAQVESLCRQILQADPEQFEALYLLGVTAYQVGRLDLAAQYAGQTLRLKPDCFEAFNLQGVAQALLGRLPEAVASYRQAVRLQPAYPEAHANLGSALQQQGQLDEAVACYQQALRLNPNFVAAHNNLGNAFKDQGRLREAELCYQRALQRDPGNAETHNNLGTVLHDLGRVDEAAACFRYALNLRPDFADALNNLGVTLYVQGKLDEAEASILHALHLRPNFAAAHNNLGNVLKDQGVLDEALVHFRRAIEINPAYIQAHSSLVYHLNFDPASDPANLLEEHRRWNRQHAEPLSRSLQPHANDRSPDRRLRVGYVSPDFRWHPVGRFLLPLLAAHDQERFEIFCYASLAASDEITDRCQVQANVWRQVLSHSDEQLAQLIRQDQIDILVDLTMHMVDNRLLVFARKPAPVQLTYLAYCATTGLSTIDYRLTDPYLDPPGQDDRFYTEESIRLPRTYWCYQPPPGTPPVPGLPALEAGHVTFGCLNNFCKVTPPTLETWSRLLLEMPRSHLLLHVPPGSHRDRVRDILAHRGVSADRLTFVARLPLADYFRLYEKIDLALDPFPYGGGTTTCDAMWMGVPVISLAGRTAVGRSGLSLLSNIGLAELVASDTEQYVRIALHWASDLPRLSQLRAELRSRMQASPLMDAPQFARDVEAAYRTMWHHWCNEPPGLSRRSFDPQG